MSDNNDLEIYNILNEFKRLLKEAREQDGVSSDKPFGPDDFKYNIGLLINLNSIEAQCHCEQIKCPETLTNCSCLCHDDAIINSDVNIKEIIPEK